MSEFLTLEDMLLNGKNDVKIIPADDKKAAENAEYYEADKTSNFGLMIADSGGMIVGKTVRILGSNRSPDLRDIKEFNERYGKEGLVILGDDIFGGIFALNIGAFSEDPGEIFYYAPDCCEWESMGLKFSGLFAWLKDGDLPGFYGQFSNEEYEQLRAMNVPFNKVLHFFPPQWSLEFKTQKHDVRPISVEEYYKLTFEG